MTQMALMAQMKASAEFSSGSVYAVRGMAAPAGHLCHPRYLRPWFCI
jgi:hypothetical protein